MITDSFDDRSKAIIEPFVNKNAPTADACILTFSNKILSAALRNYDCKEIGRFNCATRETPVYLLERNGKRFAFFMTMIGVPAADYIVIKNHKTVAQFMEENGIPYVPGKTWTTDAFYRETVNNFQKRKADGCISVEMECAALQAMCDFRGLEFYTFFTSGDLPDAPEWDKRHEDEELEGTQHDAGHFVILRLRWLSFCVSEDILYG